MDWVTAIKEIQKAQEDDRLVIFVGAGVSKNSGAPSWYELIAKFADEVGYSRCDTCSQNGNNCPKPDCKKQYEYSQEEFLRIPEYYYQRDDSPNHTNYFGLIQSMLQCDNNSNAIDDEIFSVFPRHIITTNYDQLLEKSSSVNSLLYAVVTRDSDLLSEANDRYIIKMHGDLGKPDTIVLKESDYIRYEQEHPLICTFIKSLLVNHTFVFLGYSLNDNNLNLIIGWINYFSELHGVKERPANFWVTSKPIVPFEEARLENRNIYLVDLSSLPADLEEKAIVPSSITDNTGRKLFTFLRCITNPSITYQHIPLENRIVEKYQLLKSYLKISHQDLIAVHPLGPTRFLDAELVFYDKSWYECIQKLLSDSNSNVSDIYRRAGISTIRFFGNNSSFSIPGTYEPIDSLFQLYLDNNYITLNREIETCKDLVYKMYYSSLLGKSKENIDTLLSAIAKTNPPVDYVSILLSKMRSRIATLSLFERQENKTLELQRAFHTSPPDRYKNAVSFLRMLFDSSAKNMQEMEDILSQHEKRYEFDSKTTYLDRSHIGLWELKAFAYDYYFFFKINGIPLDYFSEPKEYFSYYLKALLCSYSPISKSSDMLGFGAHKDERNYPIDEVALDMLIKFTSPKTLKSWLKRYSVQHLIIKDGVATTEKFVNLCASLSQFRIRYWAEQIHSFTIILCLIDLDETSTRAIFKALAGIVTEAAKSASVIATDCFDAIELAVNHMSINGKCVERTLLLEALLANEIYPSLIKQKSSSFGRILKRFSKDISPEVKNQIQQHINAIGDDVQKVNQLYFFRYLYTKEFCFAFFQEHFNHLSSEQCYNLLIDQFIPFDAGCWTKFVTALENQVAARKAQPETHSFPDWIMVTIEECIILKLLGFNINLASLKPYAQYSEHLSFMINPEAFDYSQVNTDNYMWQNLIYSKEYQHFFVDHKNAVLSDNLRKSFDLGVATKDQQKIVYGILLDRNELQRF